MADRALIMAGSPGQIVHELDVALDDPRDRQDPKVQSMRARLMDSFQDAANAKKNVPSKEAGEMRVRPHSTVSPVMPDRA